MAIEPNPRVFNFTSTAHDDSYDFVDPKHVNLKGKNVLITGASRGIGRALAISYSKAGASGIAISARSSLSSVVNDMKAAAQKSSRSEPHVVPLTMDVVSVASVHAAREQLNESFQGQLDIVVANHGVLEKSIPISESDPDTWWNTYEVNVRGAYNVAREFLPLLQKRESLGIFVGMSSIGQHLTMAGWSSYQSGKLALHRIVEFINYESTIKEEAGNGKSVCAFVTHPGGVKTDMADNFPQEMLHLLVDKPELCGDTMVWLTQERRDWLKGRYISCNWDMKELEEMKDAIVQNDSLKMRMTL